jgi:hypothetical protein
VHLIYRPSTPSSQRHAPLAPGLPPQHAGVEHGKPQHLCGWETGIHDYYIFRSAFEALALAYVPIREGTEELKRHGRMDMRRRCCLEGAGLGEDIRMMERLGLCELDWIWEAAMIGEGR